MRTLRQVHTTVGTFAWTWNGRNEVGQLMPSGIYLYEVQCGNERVAAKMLMLK
jgi:hypothetical protein